MVKRPVIRKSLLAVRNTRAVACGLAVLALLIVGSRTAGRNVLPALASFVGLSALCVYFIARTASVRRRAEADVRELDHTVAQRATELQHAGERYLSTLDQLLAGCQLLDFDWRYLYVNDAVAKHGRKTREELLGRTMMECYPGIEEMPVFGVLQRCMLSRTPGHVEDKFWFADGSTGWFEISVHPAPEGIFVVSIDVTDRRQAEIAVRQQLARVQSLRAIDLAILGTTDVRRVFKIVLDEAMARLQTDGGMIHLFKPESLLLDAVSFVGDCRCEMDRPPIRLGDGVAGRAALERRTVSESGANRITYATPLVAKGKLIGVLSLTCRASFTADQEWIDFFETVSGQAAMAVDNGQMYADLQRSMLDLHLAYDTTIEGWSRALDLRDEETEGHTQRVTEMTMKIARMAGIGDAQLQQIRRGALLHDIGKMGIPDRILLKPDKLTDEEWVQMRKHPTYAYELLKPIEYLRDALDIPYCHHEKWDGSGYPRGLKGEEIPLAARLFAVVDVWDAIRSDRPYRKGWSEKKSLEFIRSVTGTHFDPKAVEIFLRVIGEMKHSVPAEALVEN